MPRRARLIVPGVPLHLIQRGDNRQVCFVADDDYRIYLDWLKEYVLVQYILHSGDCWMRKSSTTEDGAGSMMKRLG